MEEIQRHLWIESEKAGQDIGFERAKEDWLKRFSVTWMEYHMPAELLRARKATSANTTPTFAKNTKTPENFTAKRRRAKSYFG